MIPSERLKDVSPGTCMPLLTTLVAIGTALSLVLQTGCQTNHYSNAILKEREKPTDPYVIPTEPNTHLAYAKNAIFVPKNSRFSLSIGAINPAWVHQAVSRNVNIDAADLSTLTTAEAAYIEGTDLWVLISVRTTDPTDPLEFSTKQITKASLVKYNIRSFGVIPLDDSEQTPFALEANSSYEVDITIYQVKDVFLKRIAAEYYRNSPGVSGLVKDAWGAVGSTFKSIVGDPLVKLVKKEYGTDLALERTLLQFGAILEFHGQFSILRSKDEAPVDAVSKDYILTDPLKSGYPGTPGRQGSFNGSESYWSALQTAQSAVNLPLRPGDSFVTFSVISARSPIVKQAEADNEKAANEEKTRQVKKTMAIESKRAELATAQARLSALRTTAAASTQPHSVFDGGQFGAISRDFPKIDVPAEAEKLELPPSTADEVASAEMSVERAQRSLRDAYKSSELPNEKEPDVAPKQDQRELMRQLLNAKSL